MKIEFAGDWDAKVEAIAQSDPTMAASIREDWIPAIESFTFPYDPAILVTIPDGPFDPRLFDCRIRFRDIGAVVKYRMPLHLLDGPSIYFTLLRMVADAFKGLAGLMNDRARMGGESSRQETLFGGTEE